MSQGADVDPNDALRCPTPASLRPKNITAVVAVAVVMISPSPIGLKDITAVVAVTVHPSSVGFLLF